jgi:hypothetical protein
LQGRVPHHAALRHRPHSALHCAWLPSVPASIVDQPSQRLGSQQQQASQAHACIFGSVKILETKTTCTLRQSCVSSLRQLSCTEDLTKAGTVAFHTSSQRCIGVEWRWDREHQTLRSFVASSSSSDVEWVNETDGESDGGRDQLQRKQQVRSADDQIAAALERSSTQIRSTPHSYWCKR